MRGRPKRRPVQRGPLMVVEQSFLDVVQEKLAEARLSTHFQGEAGTAS